LGARDRMRHLPQILIVFIPTYVADADRESAG